MLPRRRPFLAPLTLAIVLAGAMARLAGSAAADLPSHLTDQEFWQLTEGLSEPNGTFQSDNLLSNEIVFARMVPDLVARTKPGGVYLGVGPEQNFTYIAAMKPRIAFITDIRRGNLHLQLMYKALFELSADRSEFVARLFTHKRQSSVSASSTVSDLMTAYWDAFADDDAAYDANLQAIEDQLTKKHALPLSADDLVGIARVYRAFYWYGPAMNYSASTSLNMAGAGLGRPTYWDLMTQTDASDQGFSYLASEEKFAVMKDLESRNMIVPVVGNFSGPKALRAVGAYVRAHGATVGAFYVSNVESYLWRDGSWPAFCANVAMMPLDDASVFIRPSGGSAVVFSTGAPRSTIVNGASGVSSIVFVSRSGSNTSGPMPLGAGLVPIAAEVKSCSGG